MSRDWFSHESANGIGFELRDAHSLFYETARRENVDFPGLEETLESLGKYVVENHFGSAEWVEPDASTFRDPYGRFLMELALESGMSLEGVQRVAREIYGPETMFDEDGYISRCYFIP